MKALTGYRWLFRVFGGILISYGLILFAVNSFSAPSTNTGNPSNNTEKNVVLGLVPQAQPASPRHPSQMHSTAPGSSRPQGFVSGSPADVQVGAPLDGKRVGDLNFVNLSHAAVPVLSFGIFLDFKVRPTQPGTVHYEIITKGGYEQWFQNNRAVLLIGFESPSVKCKNPVSLGRVPKEPHSLKITITAADEKKCLGESQ
ncbi:MAG TPA: hypothetical protein VFK06_15155 [Candidatus Angelobacter sp.]|nr:hypothetical protein [Candidatus Angelobacter sp.]